MKRIATIGAVVTAFAVAPSLAAGGGFAAEVKPQVSAEVVGAQIVGTEITNAQIAKAPRARVAVSVERQLVQIELARRFAELRPQTR